MKKIFYILTVGLLFSACNNDDPIPEPLDPNTYPTVTYTLENPSTEGSTLVQNDTDTIVVTVTMSKPIKFPTSFIATQVGGTATAGTDFVLGSVDIPAYQTTGQFEIAILNNPLPEVLETVEIEVSAEGPEWTESFFSPDSEPLLLNFSIASPSYNENAAIIGLSWNPEQASDLDILYLNDGGGLAAYSASAANPEIAELSNAVPDDTYYATLLPFAYSTPQFEYTFSIAKPNGEVVFINGIFDTENTSKYVAVDVSGIFGEAPGTYTGYRVMAVEKAGTTFTFTSLP